MKKTSLTLALTLAIASISAQNIKLPAPQKTGGKPLMEALNNRKTLRQFDEKALPQQLLSNLLWAASGVNREDGRMTAPTASNNQQVVIFVALKDAVYEYLPKTHELKMHLKGDHRNALAMQQAEHFKTPVLLAFVSDWNKMSRYDAAAKTKYSHTDVGNVSQNVYLFCASEGLATVAIGRFDSDLLKKTLKLGDNYYPVLSQAVGFPKN